MTSRILLNSAIRGLNNKRQPIRVAVFLWCLFASFACTYAENATDIRTLNPASLPAPFKNRFSHGKLVPSGAEWLYTAGQTGRDVDGRIGEGIEEQADFAMRNLYNIVEEAGMTSEDVIKMTIFYLDPAHLPVIVAARNRYFGEDFRPASTAVGIAALANPKYLVEVELVAARIPSE
jgi:enamine deaminase RidA (YjgF/YER057c/UK114 family)